jgi:hypothetical protein
MREIPEHALKIVGTVLTVGKLNKNGWAIPEEEVPNVLSSLRNAVIRICNVPPGASEHVCDRTGDRFSEIGFFVDAYREGDEIKAVGYITDREAIRKIRDGTWSRTWSLYGNGEIGEDGFARSVRIHSVTLVRNPAYEEARFDIASAESLGRIWRGEYQVIEAGAVPKHTTPLSKKTSWDADAAVRRIRKWASSDGSGDKEKINWKKYREAFAWYDASDPENFGSYKLPHHDVEDGKLVVVWRGVVAAMAALMGARGGVDIPDSDRKAVYNHLAAHYEQFEKEAPEFKGEMNVEEERKENTEEVAAAEAQETETSPESHVDIIPVAAAKKEEIDIEAIKAAVKEELKKEALVDEIIETLRACELLADEEVEVKRASLMASSIEELEAEKKRVEKIKTKLSASVNKFSETKLVTDTLEASGLTVGYWDPVEKRWKP